MTVIPGSGRQHDSLVTACCAWLALHRIPHTRVNQKPHRQADGSWRQQGADPGAPDILACYEDRCYALELKTGGAGLRVAQRSSLERWEAAGAVARVVRSVTDLPGIFGS